jgi:hypothetical protein
MSALEKEDMSALEKEDISALEKEDMSAVEKEDMSALEKDAKLSRLYKHANRNLSEHEADHVAVPGAKG